RFFKAITGGNTDAVSIVPGAPNDFIMHAEAGVRALMLLEEGRLGFAVGKWSLAGVATDPGTKDDVVAALDASSGSAWTSDISLPAQPAQTLAVNAATVSKTPVDEKESISSGLAACQTQLAELSARNEILFRPGAAVIAPESGPALDELAADLAACPGAKVEVEGHTDADGDDQLNLALSVARAEAVIEALLARDVAAERLYALGYGETSPISNNDTPEGKRLNRRIVVKVSSEL
ncbi:MAG TPA: OmpA family protein, partial [Devosia sp.]